MNRPDPVTRQRLIRQFSNPIVSISVEEKEIEGKNTRLVEDVVRRAADHGLLQMLVGKLYLELEWDREEGYYDPCHVPEIRAWARELCLNLPFIPYLIYPEGPGGESQLAYLAALTAPLTSAPHEPPAFAPEPLVEYVQVTCEAVLRLAARLGDPGGRAWCDGFASLFGLEPPEEFYRVVFESIGRREGSPDGPAAIMEFGGEKEGGDGA